MRTIIILFIASLIITVESVGQNHQISKNAVYIVMQPADFGMGIRGDYHFWKAGVYGSASYGTLGLYKRASLKKHIKLTAGVLIPLKRYLSNQFDISVGLNYHYVEKIKGENLDYWAGTIFYYPWSYEIGLTIKLKRITMGVRTDIMRWEPCIDVGIPIWKL